MALLAAPQILGLAAEICRLRPYCGNNRCCRASVNRNHQTFARDLRTRSLLSFIRTNGWVGYRRSVLRCIRERNSWNYGSSMVHIHVSSLFFDIWNLWALVFMQSSGSRGLLNSSALRPRTLDQLPRKVLLSRNPSNRDREFFRSNMLRWMVLFALCTYWWFRQKTREAD